MPAGKRYSTRKKNIILKEIVEHNKTHGKGGIFRAHKKHGVAIKTLNNWLGKSAPGKAQAEPESSLKKTGGRKKTVRATRRKRVAAKKAITSKSFSGKFNVFLKKIEKYERQIKILEAFIAKEKATLQGLLG